MKEIEVYLESLIHEHYNEDSRYPLVAYKAIAGVLIRLQLLWRRMCPSVTPGDVTASDKHVSSSCLEGDSSSNPLGPLIPVAVNSKVVTPISLSPHSKPSKESVKGVRQTVVNLANRIATYNLGLRGVSLVNGKQHVYLLYPFDAPLQLDTSNTLGKVFFGSFGVKLNTFYKRNLWFAISLAALWLFGPF
jgi:hypothetical protein